MSKNYLVALALAVGVWVGVVLNKAFTPAPPPAQTVPRPVECPNASKFRVTPPPLRPANCYDLAPA